MRRVAPLAGAWIEIEVGDFEIYIGASHPSRVRGLKSVRLYIRRFYGSVAPLAGAWIEILFIIFVLKCIYCRTPRGCVD